MELRRQIAMLRQKMAAALAHEGQPLGMFTIEGHHRLDPECTVLRPAKGQKIDARAMGQIGRIGPGADHRIGEARAIHMQRKLMLPRHRGDFSHHIRRPDPPPFG